MPDVKNIEGHFYPLPHSAWGGFAEELFHYTSRYYCATEAFLRNLAADPQFSMTGYNAARLSAGQRDLMAAVLSCAPGRESATALVAIVGAVVTGTDGVDASIAAEYGGCLDDLPKHAMVEQHVHDTASHGDVDPLDPFMSLAERLLMPVAVVDRHVEVSLHELARHLQSPNSTLRTNLHNAIVELHNAGYVLRNHPHLTHSEAHTLADDGAG